MADATTSAGDDPFDNYSNEAEVGVGFSDMTLLGVSVLGFCVMAYLVYSIVISRVKSYDELEKGGEGGGDLDYEEELLRSDVASLTRAQRRARAKALMKRERRAVASNDVNGDGEGDDQEEHHHHHHGDDDAGPQLSRKERQKAAKAAEKKERHLMDEQRAKEQRREEQVAQQEKKKRLELEAEIARQEKLRREAELEQRKQEEYDQWNTFLASPDQTMSLSVEDWVQELQKKGTVTVDLRALTTRFDCSMKHVKERIFELVTAGRINGVVAEDTFYVFSHAQLLSLATFVASNGEVSLREFAQETNRLLETTTTQ